MNVFFYTDPNWGFEPWNYLSPNNPGIGGSETAQVEMSWRMARRGHQVTSYAPLPVGTAPEWRGTLWEHSKNADFSQDGLWVLSRCPEALDHFGPRRAEQRRWLVCQDVHYHTLTPERAEKLDIIFPLCFTHGQYLKSRFPFVRDKIRLSANGIRSDEIRKLLKQNIKRNPNRLIWTSSPDRGLETMLGIFKRVREHCPEVELHCFYGWDNIDKIIQTEEMGLWKEIKERCETMLQQPNVFWHGRVPQGQLYEEYLKSGMWCYPTEFQETSCVNCMDAQACGAIPITTPLWGLAQNVRHGILIEGDPWQDSLTRARYGAEIIRLVKNPQDQETIRKEMQLDALVQHNWENVVNQYEAMMLGYEDRGFAYQYNYQIKQAQGRVINIGANSDAPGFGKIEGNVNVELHDVDPYTKIPNAPHVRADARQLPQELWGQFDTAVLGDILEHMNNHDIVASINNAKRATKGGRVVITFPTDDRAEFLHDEARHTNVDYLPGIKAHHFRVLTKELFEEIIIETGLKVQHHEFIDYGFSGGHGYVLR